MSIARGLIYAATGALRGFETKKENEREEEERERSQRLRELQEMTYLTSLLNTPGVVPGGDTRAGMEQLGPAPKGLGDVPMAGGILEAGWNVARGAGQRAGPERDVMQLGQAGGQEIGFDPYMSSSAQATRALRAEETKGFLETAEAEIVNFEAYQELQKRGVRVGSYNEAVDYSAIVETNVKSGITEGRTYRGAEHQDTLMRGRKGEADAEAERTRMTKLAVRNRAFTTFMEDPDATVGDFQKTMSSQELDIVDLPSLQKIRREASQIVPDDGPEELRRGLSRVLGTPGSRRWTAPGDSVESFIDPTLHQDVFDMLTQNYPGMGRPLSVEEILKNFRSSWEAGDLSEFELKSVEELLRPIPGDESLEDILRRKGF
jgi:hypothetical protein